MGTHDWEAIEKDRETKKRLIVEKITSRCNESSPHAALRDIGQLLETTNDVLVAEVLTGGLTNFSYKVYASKSPDKILFAKLSFPYALWNPDPDVFYDVKRTLNEYEMMVQFSKMAPDCAVKPYFCEAIGDMMLIVTEFCSGADEQLANQFIDGNVDTRIASNLANAAAKLHSYKDFDPHFNDNVRPCVSSLFEPLKESLCSLADSSDSKTSRTHQIAKEIGKDDCAKIMDTCLADLDGSRDCLNHSDLHVFNLLVENKPSVDSLENFGSDGSLYVCDWEMAMPGPLGRDLGIFHAFPVACAVAHAINGHKDSALQILDFLDTLWDEYATALKKQENKTDEEMLKIYRSFIGWTGAFIFGAYFVLGAHVNYLPIEETATEDQEKLRDSIGALSIKFLQMGFVEDSKCTLEEVRESYREAVMEEIVFAMSAKRPRRQRRMSALRVSGRRVSDAGLYCSSRTLASLGETTELAEAERTVG